MSNKSKSKAVAETQGSTLQERRKQLEKEQREVQKEVEKLITWTEKIEKMDEAQLKNYLKNRPKHLKEVKKENLGKSRRLGVERCKKLRCTGIIAAVWKFNKAGE